MNEDMKIKIFKNQASAVGNYFLQNRPQLIVYNDHALDRFKDAHDILDNIRIKRPRPNEDANIVQGHRDRILVRIRLIHQAGLYFLISPLLKEVMTRCQQTFMQVLINFVRTMLVVDMLVQRENLTFNASNLLHVYNMVCSRREPRNNLYIGNHYL